MDKLPNDLFAIGGKIYGFCKYCGRMVRINKPIFGSFHFCLTEEERKEKDCNEKKDTPL